MAAIGGTIGIVRTTIRNRIATTIPAITLATLIATIDLANWPYPTADTICHFTDAIASLG